ncbi:hypothetical protein E2542_SST08043 [Spatholobus suberectus]|nr:hypothetical protein E2542_SST08043 [Spatholobus suberectus]
MNRCTKPAKAGGICKIETNSGRTRVAAGNKFSHGDGALSVRKVLGGLGTEKIEEINVELTVYDIWEILKTKEERSRN